MRKKQTHKLKKYRHLILAEDLGEGAVRLENPVLGGLNLGLAQLLRAVGLGVGVQPEENLLVLERVLLLDTSSTTTLLDGTTLLSANNTLDLRGVDEAGNVGVGDSVSGEEVVLLEGGGGGGGAVELVKSRESGVGPDDETSEMSTRGELEEVEGLDGASLNTGDVPEGTSELDGALSLGVVDNERATALANAASPDLALAGTELAGLGDLDDVGVGTETLEEGDGLTGLGERKGRGGQDERKLRDRGHTVSTGEDKGNNRRSSNGRRNSVAPRLVSNAEFFDIGMPKILTSGSG